MSNFPAVATVIGVSQEVVKSGPLLATIGIDPNLMATQPAPAVVPPAVEPVDIKAGDPVTQAVVDNIIGKLPTKKEPVKLRCEICNITVSHEEILAAHLAGQKHAKKLKGHELVTKLHTSADLSKFIGTPKVQNGDSGPLTEFLCKICNIRLNSHQQLDQHLSGSKHKAKAETTKSNTMPMAGPNINTEGPVNVDIGPNRLYCATCNVHVNSDQQYEQHISSAKHANRVNGRAQTSGATSRGSPYFRRGPGRGAAGRGGQRGRGSGRGFGRGGAGAGAAADGQWSNGYQKKVANTSAKYNFDNVGWAPNPNPSPRPSGPGMGIGRGMAPGPPMGMGAPGPNWSQPRSPAPNKPFIPGGTLYSRR